MAQTAADILVEVLQDDPFTPPMPPKVTVEQAAKFGESLLKGQRNRRKIALTVLSDTVREQV